MERWICDNEPSKRWPVYTRGNVGEVYPDVVSPLGWTLLDRRAEVGWRRAYKELGAFRDRDFDGDLNILGVFNGYCYLNASLLRVFGVRVPGSSAEAIDTQLLGEASAPPYDERKGDRSLWLSTKLLRSVLHILNGKGLPGEAVRARALADARLRKKPADDAHEEELMTYLGSYAETFEDMFRLHLIDTAGSQIAGGYLAYLCLRAGDPGLQLDLSTDLGEVESALPGQVMWELSRLVRAEPEVGALFDAGMTGLAERLRRSEPASEFNDRFAAFLDEHGHRGPNEWELASPTWRSRPDIALAAIDRMRLADDSRGPSEQRSRARVIRERAEAEILDNLGWRDRRNYRRVRRASGRYAQAREATKNQIIRTVNAARECAMELARRAAENGGETEFRRFCMVTFDELPDYLADPPSFASVIEERHQFYERLSQVDPPFVVAGQPPALEDLEVDQPDLGWVPEGTELQGAGGSPGVVAGRARVILDASDPTALEPGDILVAPITDPSWTPLFMPAGGVVVDVGAIQSHAVVVSRELCIPCVVSVKRATEIIPDGSWIEIDGSQGTVKVLAHPAAAITG